VRGKKNEMFERKKIILISKNLKNFKKSYATLIIGLEI